MFFLSNILLFAVIIKFENGAPLKSPKHPDLAAVVTEPSHIYKNLLLGGGHWGYHYIRVGLPLQYLWYSWFLQFFAKLHVLPKIWIFSKQENCIPWFQLRIFANFLNQQNSNWKFYFFHLLAQLWTVKLSFCDDPKLVRFFAVCLYVPPSVNLAIIGWTNIIS